MGSKEDREETQALINILGEDFNQEVIDARIIILEHAVNSIINLIEDADLVDRITWAIEEAGLIGYMASRRNLLDIIEETIEDSDHGE